MIDSSCRANAIDTCDYATHVSTMITPHVQSTIMPPLIIIRHDIVLGVEQIVIDTPKRCAE